MDLFDACREAFRLLFSGDGNLWTIVWISLRVSLLALLIATPPAVALGFFLAVSSFPGRRACVILLQSLLSFPTVVVGLILFLSLTRQGPFGGLQLLYTQEAMIIGQALIAFPVLAAFALSAVQGADVRVRETARTLGASRMQAAWTTLFEVRFAVVAGVLNGFGRVISEVGCAMMVGGNILGITRNIPTAISLETSKGDFAQGIALGAVLMVFAISANLALAWVQGRGGID